MLVLSIVAQSRDVPVTSARLRHVREPVTALSVSITNLRKVPLDYWQYRLIGPAGTATAHGWVRLASGAAAYVTAPTHERLHISEGPAGAWTGAQLRLAVFADGVIDGDPDAIQEELASRDRAVADAAYWVQTVEQVPITSDAEAIAFVQRRLEARPASTDPGASQTGANLLRAMSSRAREGQARAKALSDIPMLRQELQTALDHQRRARPVETTPSPAPSVVLTSKLIETTRVALVMDNLSTQPIEAWATGRFERRNPRLLNAAMMIDTCPERGVATTGVGPIQPNETRRLQTVSDRDVPDTELPTYVLTLVLFEDLRFEGSADWRDRILAGRTKSPCKSHEP